MNVLTIPRPQFDALLRALLANPNQMALCPAGISRSAKGLELVVRRFELVSRDALNSSASQGENSVLVALSQNLAKNFIPPRNVAGCLLLGHEGDKGTLAGFVRTSDGIAPLHLLKLPGAGMYRIWTLHRRTSPLALQPNPPAPFPTREEGEGDRWSGGEGATEAERLRYSRTMGALGSEAVWRRLVELRCGIVGLGRTGSLVATSLARLGVRTLTFIDPDAVELHNLDSMDAVTPADVGVPKVDAVAAGLRVIRPDLEIRSLALEVDTSEAVEGLKLMDVLISCVDNDAARLATGVLAALYGVVLLDIGTGVTHDGRRGADVRLILPGDRCIRCLGSVAQYERAVARLTARPQVRPRGARLQSPPFTSRRPQGARLQPDAWSQERAGSLRTLNQVAVHVALQALQDLVAERIQASLWARLEVDAQGRWMVNYPAPEPLPNCPLCARAGLGDAGLFWREETREKLNSLYKK